MVKTILALVAVSAFLLACGITSDSESASRDYKKCEYNGEVFEVLPSVSARKWDGDRNTESSTTNMKVVHSEVKMYDPLRDKRVPFCLIRKADWPEAVADGPSELVQLTAETPRGQRITAHDYDP